MPRYFLHLAFKGTAYSGWQIQQNAYSVQQRLNEALAQILRRPVETTGCGRTDTGVHARQFYVHFDADAITRSDQFIYQLNSVLPPDIAVYDVIPTEPDAHARFDAVSRSYSYYITHRKDPFTTDTAWFWRDRPDIGMMNAAAEMLIAEREFRCFAKQGGNQDHYRCTVSGASWKEEGNMLVFTITANRFLRGMVRAIVGTLIDAGKGKISIAAFKDMIENGNRSDAGESVPAHGLFLTRIIYPYIQDEGPGSFYI